MQSRLTQFGAAQVAIAQVRVAECGMVHFRSEKPHPLHRGHSETSSLGPNSLQTTITQIGTCELGAAQVCSGQIGTAQFAAHHSRFSKLGAGKIGSGEIGSAQLELGKIQSGKPGSNHSVNPSLLRPPQILLDTGFSVG